MREAHNTDVALNFYNDRIKEVIADADIAEPFTYVPIKAGHMELVGGNALVFGNITEGYDVINPDVEAVLSYEDISTELPRINLAVEFVKISEETYIIVDGYPPKYSGNRLVVARMVITLPLTVHEGDFYYVTIHNESRGLDLTAEYEVQPGDTYVEVKAGLEADMVLKGVPAAEIEVGADANKIYLFETEHSFLHTPVYEATDLNKIFEDFNPPVTAYYLIDGNVKLYPQLKVGATHGFGIVYKDRSGRTCSVMKTDGMTVYIPFYAQKTDNLIASIVNLVFQIYHRPPSWAKTYEIVYFGNLSMDFFLQIRIDNITSLGANRYAVNIAQTITDTYNHNNRWRVPTYEWKSGDRMRLIGTIDETTGVVTKYNVLYDFEIEQTTEQHGEDQGGDWLSIQAITKPDWFGNETQIENTGGTLTGTVVQTQPFEDGTTRVDTLTLALGGAGDTADVYCGGLIKELVYNASLDQTATDFVTNHAAAYLLRGVIVTAPGGGTLVFTMNTDSVDFPSQTNILVEIYRPRKGIGRTVAYGTGMVFEIGEDENGFLYHKGDTDQVFSSVGACTTKAEIQNTANDCWKFIRINYKWGADDIQPFHAESYYPSDWWDGLTASNRLTSDGFPFLDDLSQKQTVLQERIRHGGFLITGTRTNNIAHFTYEDFRDLAKKDGPITALREVGYTLKVLQYYKETSIYVNRIVNFNADGTEDFTLTDRFLGTIYPMNDDYGCQHPNGVLVNNRNLYYWDNSQGELIRSAPNGQIAISGPDYKLSRWFKDIVKWIKTSGGKEILKVNLGANNEHEEIWVTFNMNDVIEGIIFSEKRGRFTSRLNQITESYVHLGNFFAHMYRQRLWIMNIDEGQNWLYWSGNPTYALVEVVSNVDVAKNKVFTSIAVMADHLMESLERYVKIPAEASAVNVLQETNVPLFDRREGVFFGEIMKDVNSKGLFANLYDRKLNGNEMRGRYCFAKFFTDEHDEKVRIDSITIFSTPSERNVQ